MNHIQYLIGWLSIIVSNLTHQALLCLWKIYTSRVFTNLMDYKNLDKLPQKERQTIEWNSERCITKDTYNHLQEITCLKIQGLLTTFNQWQHQVLLWGLLDDQN